MNNLATTDRLFFERAGMDRDRITRIVDDTLDGADDGKRFIEYRQSESLAFDDGAFALAFAFAFALAFAASSIRRARS